MNQPDPSEHPTAALRRTHRWRMALSGLMILVAGITLGAAGTVMIVRPNHRRLTPPSPPDMATAREIGIMQRMLDLSRDQVEQIGSILREHFEALEAIRVEARPRIDAELEDMKKKVSAVLTPDQRERWQGITESLDQAVHRGFGRRGGGSRRGGGPGDGRGTFRGGPDRSGFGSGPRPDSNEPRWGGRGFNPFDPNGPRRSLDGRRDPNGLPPRTFDMRQGRDGPSRSFGRRGGMDGRMIEPNAPDRMPLGGPPVDPNHIL